MHDALGANPSRRSPPTARAPRRGLAVVTCMDARIDLAALLGIEPCDAHVIRNAGGVVTEDVIRSLAISQRILGTTHVIVMHHTDCGMTSFGSERFRRDIERETGVRPTWSAESFLDPVNEVRQSVRRLASSPFVSGTVEGLVWDVHTGDLLEIEPIRPVDSGREAALGR